VIDVWAFDSWFCNIDRGSEGNTLLTPMRGGVFSLIAADQSDCFGGSGRAADGSWQRVMSDDRPGQALPFLDRAVYDQGGGKAIRASISKVQAAASRIETVLDEVPQDWWLRVPELRKEALMHALAERAQRMGTILDLQKWEDMDNATRGGQILF
jgi:hypothetical protein